jgi:hypothetical protein
MSDERCKSHGLLADSGGKCSECYEARCAAAVPAGEGPTMSDEAGLEILEAYRATLEAFHAMVIVTKQGQPCYRTSNGVPQGMPKAVERKAKRALKALKAVTSPSLAASSSRPTPEQETP